MTKLVLTSEHFEGWEAGGETKAPGCETKKRHIANSDKPPNFGVRLIICKRVFGKFSYSVAEECGPAA